MCYFFLIAVSNIVSECVIMHAKTSLFQNDLCSPKSFQIPSEITIYRLLFLFFLCSSTSFQIPSESNIYCSSFQIFQEATLVLMLPSCFGTKYVLFFILKFQISFKKCQRQVLATMFKKCPSSSKFFQIISESML